jgi:hypothetical protein
MKKIIPFLSLICFPVLVQAQTSTDIVLLDVVIKNNRIELSNLQNITSHPGYDNQPHFHKTEPLIYYSSANPDGKMDIRSFNLHTKQTTDFTTTPENEFSPTLTPDGKHISCIIQRDNGKQDLGMYHLDTKEVTVLIDDLTVGYHAWIDKNNLLLFILAENGNELHHYNLSNKQNKVLAKGIGRSLHKIPGQNAMSFIDKSDKEQWQIKRYDNKTGAITTVVNTLHQTEDITWTKNGQLISSNGNQLYKYNPGKDQTWLPVTVKENADMLKGITRLAINPSSNKLAVVVSE